jgi:tetratricopeptide (TPR) repeat protein
MAEGMMAKNHQWRRIVLLALGLVAMMVSMAYGETSKEPSSVSVELGSEDRTIRSEEPLVIYLRAMQEAIRAKSLVRLEEAFHRASGEAQRLGLLHFSEYSRVLLEAAAQESDPTMQEAIVRYAVALSPHHPLVQYEASRFQNGYAPWGSVFQLAMSFWGYSSLWIPFLSSFVYPILFALSFGFLLTSVFLLIAFPEAALSPLERFRGVLSLPRQFVFLIVPLVIVTILCGPLPSILLFGLLLGRFRRSIALLAGGIVLLWCVVLPVYERFSAWERDDGMQIVFRLLERDYAPGGMDQLEAQKEIRPEDPLVLSALYALRVRKREPAAAEEILDSLEQMKGESEWLSLRRGILFLTQQDYERASQSFERAVELGGRSAESLYWLSQARFSLLEVGESRDLYQEARSRNETRVKQLESQEPEEGKLSQWFEKDIRPPLSYYLASASIPFKAGEVGFQRKFRALAGPVPYWALVLLALGVLLLALPDPGTGFLQDREKTRRSRRLLVICPAGLFIGHRFGTLLVFPNTVTLFLCIFLIFGWPGECERFFRLFPELAPVVIFFLALTVLSSYPVGWIATRWGRS